MRPIRNIEDIENLKTDEKLIECLNGEVNYYRFLCFHPRNDEYVILLNHCEQPVRFYIKSIIDRCYTDYTTRDIVTYKRDYALEQVKFCEQALSEFDKEGKKMKQTVEEAAKECRRTTAQSIGVYAQYHSIDECPNHGITYDEIAEAAFIKGAEWQAKQSPWISVKERLPEEDGYYIVTDGDVVKKVYFFKRWNKFALTKKYPHLFYDEGVIKAYIPVPYFNEILEDNRDVLERIKEKGD